MSAWKPKAYGGVLVDEKGRVLLRHPRGEYDGYVWTFPKGKPDPGESPEEAALREVREESGYAATIVKPIPGEFASGSSVTLYYIMKPHGLPGAFDASETTEVRWVDPATAATLIAQTFNLAGRKRDLAVLAAVVPML